MLFKLNIVQTFLLTIWMTQEINTLGFFNKNSFKVVPNNENFELTSNGFIAQNVEPEMSLDKQNKSKSLNEMNMHSNNVSSNIVNISMTKNTKKKNYRSKNLTPLNKQITGLVKIRNNALIQIPALILRRSSVLNNLSVSGSNENNVNVELSNDTGNLNVNNENQNNQESNEMFDDDESFFVGSSGYRID